MPTEVNYRVLSVAARDDNVEIEFRNVGSKRLQNDRYDSVDASSDNTDDSGNEDATDNGSENNNDGKVMNGTDQEAEADDLNASGNSSDEKTATSLQPRYTNHSVCLKMLTTPRRRAPKQTGRTACKSDAKHRGYVRPADRAVRSSAPTITVLSCRDASNGQ